MLRMLMSAVVLPLLCAVMTTCGIRIAWADPPPPRLTVATWNLEWFFDEHSGDNFADLAKQQAAPSREAWEWKLAGVAAAIAQMKPTVLALQEIENQRVLFYLTRKLKQEHGLNYTIAYVEGGDFFTEQDVAVLVQSGLVGYGVKRQTQEMFASEKYYNVNKHLFCELEWGSRDDRERVLLLNVHLRATPEATDIRKKQARLIRQWIHKETAAGENVIVLGDINTNELFAETTAEGDVGVLRGLDTPDPADDLVDLFRLHPQPVPETHLIGKQFDRILVSPSLMKDAPGRRDLVCERVTVRKDLVIRGARRDENHLDAYWQISHAERDLSDHYPVIAEFMWRP
jgi:endonuclease/exonuclease/phosphatase family metal-dependent hydrolase